MIEFRELLVSMLLAFVGGAGLIGLLMIKPRHVIEQRVNQEDADRDRLSKVDKHEELLKAIQEEQTIQCYCILACLKGLAEQGCNGPVHEGIERMEKHLNKKAHGQLMS